MLALNPLSVRSLEEAKCVVGRFCFILLACNTLFHYLACTDSLPATPLLLVLRRRAFVQRSFGNFLQTEGQQQRMAEVLALESQARMLMQQFSDTASADSKELNVGGGVRGMGLVRQGYDLRGSGGRGSEGALGGGAEACVGSSNWLIVL